MPPKDKYSDPKLRDQIKEEVMQSDKGGAPGQWSARKAQFMAAEYKKRGGGYNTEPDQKDDSQKNLQQWGEEEWQTKEGSGNAKKADGTQKRYLPKKAWEQMDDKEKEATDNKKQKESKQGKQFVSNTDKAKTSRKRVSEGQEKGKDGNAKENDESKDEDKKDEPAKKRTRGDKAGDNKQDEKKADDGEKQAGKKQSGKADDSKKADKGTDDGNKPKGKGGAATDKKDEGKTHGSKHDSSEAPAKQASKDRLPKVGDNVTWKAMPGWVQGEVTEILRKAKTINGKSVKASDEDPRIVLKSHGPSGKTAVHKPEAVYFD